MTLLSAISYRLRADFSTLDFMPVRQTPPPRLTAWIDQAVPELRGMDGVSIFACSKLPLEALWRGRRYAGLTLWNRVYIRRTHESINFANEATIDLLFHELAHVLQFARSPILFPFKYLYRTMRHGYWDNPYEIEARELAATLYKRYRLDLNS